MRAPTALAVYVSLCLATTARGDVTWNDKHYQALKAFQSNQLDIAESLLRESATLAQQWDEIGTSANDLGVLLHVQGRDGEAKQWLSSALTQWKKGRSVESSARTAHSLGSVLRTLGEYTEAERLVREALASKPGSAVTVAMLDTLLGDLLREQGRLADARVAAERALTTPDLPWRYVADASIIIADVQRETREFAASIEGWNAVLAKARERNDELIEAVALRGLGETELVSGDPASAEPNLRKALAFFENTNRAHQIAATLTCLAELYLGGSKAAMAEEALRRAVSLDEKFLGATHPQLAVLLQMRADAALRLGAAERAQVDLDRASQIITARFGDKSAVMGAFLTNRGILDERAGHPEVAASHFEKAALILRKAGPETRSVASTLMGHYATVLRQLHRKDQAKAIQAEAKTFRE